MARTYEELLRAVKAGVREVTVEEVRAAVDAPGAPRLVDCREEDEWAAGHLPGAVHLSRGLLESQVEAAFPDRDADLVIYCARGNRSALAARSLEELGYRRVASMAGGYDRWTDAGLPVVRPEVMRAEQRERYRRHLVIPEVGSEGQGRLLAGRVLLVGVGGLGSPAALYLAAAGVGTLGLVDADVVDLSNLQRQVLHSTRTLGWKKTASGAAALRDLNPDVRVVEHPERLTAANALRLLEGWDVVLDGGDNFPTRYLVNDAAVRLGLPVVHGSVYRFEGQVSVFWPGRGPCYRCLYPEPPPADLAPSCAEAGVLGVLPGVIGTLQATEAIKILLGAGQPLTGRLLAYDALEGRVQELSFGRDPACPACGPGAVARPLEDLAEACAPASQRG